MKDITQGRISNNPKIRNVTGEYLQRATPGTGNITKEPGFIDKDHEDENAFALWLRETIGGDIVQNKDSKTSGVQIADYWWHEELWELKTVSSSKYNTFDQHVRDANRQISFRRGGFFFDISSGKLSVDKAAGLIETSIRMRRIQQTDILIKKNDQFIVLRIG